MRLALGTLTILPVRPPDLVDRRIAGGAMVLAPLVGALLAAVVVLLLWLGRGLPPLPAAALAVALLAVLTRGLHLDGLADTADGLGSGRPAGAALEVMRRGDVGPFGVTTVVLVLITQVTTLGALLSGGQGGFELVVALVVSRLALPLLCSRGIPAARPDGLGSAVAGSVSRGALLLSFLLAAAAVAGTVLLVALLWPARSPAGGELLADAPQALLGPVVAVVVPLLLAGALARRCVRRLGGVTGDVLGACVEVAFTASLVALSFR